jgi:hypothetical protein
MVLLHQAVEHGLVGRAPHLPQFERAKRGQTGVQRRVVDVDRRRLGASGQRVVAQETHRRQYDVPLAVQLQHQATAYHVA